MLVSDAVILQGVADQLQAANVGALPAGTANIVATWHPWAYYEVLSRLGRRGWTLAQIQSSDQAGFYEASLAIWKSLAMASFFTDRAGASLTTANLLEALNGVELTFTQSDPTLPLIKAPEATAGQVSTGRQDWHDHSRCTEHHWSEGWRDDC